MEDSLALEEAGVFAILLEAMPGPPAGQIAKRLKIPVYGIGAGGEVDGQLVIMHDLQGFYQAFRPWFAKCYIPEVVHDLVEHLAQFPDVREAGRTDRRDGLLVLAEMAVHRYVEEVRSRKFPGKEYSYPISDEEMRELAQSRYWV